MTSTVIQAPKRFKFEEVLSKLKQSGEVLDDDDGSDGSVMSDSEGVRYSAFSLIDTNFKTGFRIL